MRTSAYAFPALEQRPPRTFVHDPPAGRYGRHQMVSCYFDDNTQKTTWDGARLLDVNVPQYKRDLKLKAINLRKQTALQPRPGTGELKLRRSGLGLRPELIKSLNPCFSQ